MQEFYWIRLRSGEDEPDERRLVMNSELAKQMESLGIREVPSFFIRSYAASFCVEHDKEVIPRWKAFVDSANGYLMEDVRMELPPKSGLCFGTNARMTTIPSMVGECDRTPVARYTMYFTTPSIIREYLRNVPQETALYQKFLEL